MTTTINHSELLNNLIEAERAATAHYLKYDTSLEGLKTLVVLESAVQICVNAIRTAVKVGA